MQMFEYIIVLISITIGLALTHLMQGIAGLIQHPDRARAWWVHLIWVAYMVLSTIFWWWWQFNLQQIVTWTFLLFVFVLCYAFLIYVICALLFPKDLDGYDGFKDYFLSRRRWFFGLLIGWQAIDLFDSWIKGPDHFASLGTEYLVAWVVFSLLAVLGMWTRRATVHAVIALLYLSYNVSWVLRLFNTVG